MPLRKDDIAYLWDMMDAAQTVSQFIHNKTFLQFLEDKLLRSAIERQLEIIGEAARRISPEFREKNKNIPWKSIIGQRNIITHDYDDLLYERIWNVCQRDIPLLMKQIEPLLPSQNQKE